MSATPLPLDFAVPSVVSYSTTICVAQACVNDSVKRMAAFVSAAASPLTTKYGFPSLTSLSSIVPTPPRPTTKWSTAVNPSLNVSGGSMSVSSVMATDTVAEVEPGTNVMVPLALV